MKLQSFLIISYVSLINCVIYNSGYFDNKQHDYIPIIENGVPIDTPEVQAAKAAHFEAYARAAALAAKHPPTKQYYQHNYQQQQPTYYGTHHRYRRNIYVNPHIPKIINGVPEETPEVQLAKYQHFVAHSLVNSHNYHNIDNGIKSHTYFTDGYYHIPVIDKNGVPIDTPEVQLARQQHLLAHFKEKHQHYGHHLY